MLSRDLESQLKLAIHRLATTFAVRHRRWHR